MTGLWTFSPYFSLENVFALLYLRVSTELTKAVWIVKKKNEKKIYYAFDVFWGWSAEKLSMISSFFAAFKQNKQKLLLEKIFKWLTQLLRYFQVCVSLPDLWCMIYKCYTADIFPAETSSLEFVLMPCWLCFFFLNEQWFTCNPLISYPSSPSG